LGGWLNYPPAKKEKKMNPILLEINQRVSISTNKLAAIEAIMVGEYSPEVTLNVITQIQKSPSDFDGTIQKIAVDTANNLFRFELNQAKIDRVIASGSFLSFDRHSYAPELNTLVGPEGEIKVYNCGLYNKQPTIKDAMASLVRMPDFETKFEILFGELK